MTKSTSKRSCAADTKPGNRGSQSPPCAQPASRTRAAELTALERESARAMREQIRRLLAKPMAERTHFLRVRLPGGGSAL